MEQAPSILQKITQLYPQMSTAQQLIADVILKDPETTAFYNIHEFARHANVSESSVTRFANFIGSSGFPALSRQLQELVRARLTTGERFQLSRTLDNDEQRIMQLFEDDVQNIQMMMERIDLAVFHEVVNLLDTAKRIGIVCSRSSVALGLFFQFYLGLYKKDVTLFTGDPRSIDALHWIGSGDVLFGIGFARYSRMTVNVLQYGKKKGAQTVAITDYPSSPLVEYADQVLYAPTGIASHMDSFVAPLSLINALLSEIASKQKVQVSETLHELERLWGDFEIYVKGKENG